MERKSSKRCPFGIEVKKALLHYGQTSRELARAVGIADSTLCDVIAGRNNSEQTKQRVMEVLKMWGEEEG